MTEKLPAAVAEWCIWEISNQSGTDMATCPERRDIRKSQYSETRLPGLNGRERVQEVTAG